MARTRVGVVVVNYDGAATTPDCIESLLATDWPPEALRVVVVDNDGSDGVAVALAGRERVEVLSAGGNVGFGAGCNLGVEALGHSVDAIALVNNDVTTSPGWLRPLVDALVGDVGATCPKVLLAGRWARVRLEHEDPGSWIHLDLVAGAEGPIHGTRHAGPWETRRRHRSLRGAGDLLVPAGPGAAPLRLVVRTDRDAQVRASTGAVTVEQRTGPQSSELVIDEDLPSDRVLNSAGAGIGAGFAGVDRGWLEPDDGRWDHDAHVTTWSANTVLLSRSYLDEVGAFDERLFLYGEDLDLALRGLRAGWQHRYVATSTVEHRHSATVGEGSPLALRLDERNRLTVACRHLRARDAAVVVARSALATASYARRDLLAAVRRRDRDELATITLRLRALAGWASMLPGTLRRRRRDPWPLLRRSELER